MCVGFQDRKVNHKKYRKVRLRGGKNERLKFEERRERSEKVEF